MGYPIQQGNTTESLMFLMVSSVDHITGLAGLVPGVTLTVTLSKNGGAFAAPAGAITEVANGWYRIAPNALDASALGALVLHATGVGADPTDDIFDVEEVAFPGAVPAGAAAAAVGGAVATRLTFAVAGKTERDVVREWLRAEAGQVEGTLVEAEYVGAGTGGAGPFALDFANVMQGTLRVWVSGVLQVETTAYTVNYALGQITFLAGYLPAGGAPITATYRYGVASSIEDSLLDILIAGAKQAADDFLQSEFREDVATITLSGVVVGDTVSVDGRTYVAAAATDVTEYEFGVGGTDDLTAVELGLCLSSGILDEDRVPYGIAGVLVSRVGAVLSLSLRATRTAAVRLTGSTHLVCSFVRTDLAIPDPVALGVLRTIARHYEQREDGVGSASVSGVGSTSFAAPPEALRLWQPYRVYRGL